MKNYSGFSQIYVATEVGLEAKRWIKTACEWKKYEIYELKYRFIIWTDFCTQITSHYIPPDDKRSEVYTWFEAESLNSYQLVKVSNEDLHFRKFRINISQINLWSRSFKTYFALQYVHRKLFRSSGYLAIRSLQIFYSY